MGDLEVFYSVLMGICAAVIAFGGAGAVIARLFAAPLKIQEKVRQHDSEIEQMREASNMQLECSLQMMNHMIDGNHTEQLVAARDKLQHFLISR